MDYFEPSLPGCALEFAVCSDDFVDSRGLTRWALRLSHEDQLQSVEGAVPVDGVVGLTPALPAECPHGIYLCSPQLLALRLAHALLGGVAHGSRTPRPTPSACGTNERLHAVHALAVMTLE